MADSYGSGLRVGILVSVGLAIFGFAVLTLGRGARFLSGGESFEAHFRPINGLQTGAPVLLPGVRVGAVEGIEFPSDSDASMFNLVGGFLTGISFSNLESGSHQHTVYEQRSRIVDDLTSDQIIRDTTVAPACSR
jgi:MlaD protein